MTSPHNTDPYRAHLAALPDPETLYGPDDATIVHGYLRQATDALLGIHTEFAARHGLHTGDQDAINTAFATAISSGELPRVTFSVPTRHSGPVEKADHTLVVMQPGVNVDFQPGWLDIRERIDSEGTPRVVVGLDDRAFNRLQPRGATEERIRMIGVPGTPDTDQYAAKRHLRDYRTLYAALVGSNVD